MNNSVETKMRLSPKDIKFIKEKMGLLQNFPKSERLPSFCILKLIDAVGSDQLSKDEKVTALNCIGPELGVPEEALIRLTCFLSDAKLNEFLKVEILVWMIQVLSFASATTSMIKLQCLYEVYLKLLRSKLLRPYVIKLLKLITTKQNVTQSRIQYIFSLMSKKELEQDFYPLLTFYTEIQPKPPFEVLQLFESLENLSNIDSRTSHSIIELDQFVSKPNAEYSSLLGYGSFEKLHQKLECLKSSSVETIMKSDLRRLLLTSDEDSAALTYFYDYVITSVWYDQDFEHSLPFVLEIVQESQRCAPPVIEFIDRILDVWDSCLSSPEFLDILAHLDIHWLKTIMPKINEKLRTLNKFSFESKCSFLSCFTRACKNMMFMLSHDCFVCTKPDVITKSEGLIFTLRVKEMIYLNSYVEYLCFDLMADSCVHLWYLNHMLDHFYRVWMIILNVISAYEDVGSLPHVNFEHILSCLSSTEIENVSKTLWLFVHLTWGFQLDYASFPRDEIPFLALFYCRSKLKTLPDFADYLPNSQMLSRIENLIPGLPAELQFLDHLFFIRKICELLLN